MHISLSHMHLEFKPDDLRIRWLSKYSSQGEHLLSPEATERDRSNVESTYCLIASRYSNMRLRPVGNRLSFQVWALSKKKEPRHLTVSFHIFLIISLSKWLNSRLFAFVSDQTNSVHPSENYSHFWTKWHVQQNLSFELAGASETGFE